MHHKRSYFLMIQDFYEKSTKKIQWVKQYFFIMDTDTVNVKEIDADIFLRYSPFSSIPENIYIEKVNVIIEGVIYASSNIHDILHFLKFANVYTHENIYITF